MGCSFLFYLTKDKLFKDLAFVESIIRICCHFLLSPQYKDSGKESYFKSQDDAVKLQHCSQLQPLLPKRKLSVHPVFIGVIN